MPDVVTIVVSAIGAAGGTIGAVGGISGYVAWRQFKHRAPIEGQDAVHESFQRQIASAEKRGDKALG